MKNIRARLIFSVYRGLGVFLYPLVPPYLSWRAVRAKEEKKCFRERIGKPSKPRPEGPLIWFHASSVGETIALMPLIERILLLDIKILLTTGTIASAQLVRERFKTRLIHQYVPLDFASAVRRFLDHWKPDLVLVCESEIWPMRINELAQRRIPQILLNARFSERSYNSWKRYTFLAREIFSKFSVVICQSSADAERYKKFDVPRVMVSGNLKADVVLPGHSCELGRYRDAIGSRPNWAAISTHEGEELMAARVHTILRKRYPDLLTIIVPRHLKRVDAIIQMLKDNNYSFSRKSLDELPNARTDILLGDTIGDMGLYLRLTEIAFVGKSLMAKGGHNPLEPAMIGAVILSGPNIENFRKIYQEFMKNKAARLVDDSSMLAGYIHHLLDRPDLRQKMIESAHQTAFRMSGALKRTFEILNPFLQPLTLSAQLNRAGGWDGK
ncbi:MAG: 3-deoxy-D-manno-octulosonic-acid transferase [Candidatus Tokpelaia sp. JSC189]|nr:MAG: 3-deoxy-D-manno-octulosonic-acid transferase [Candidatus Tokpelaia sp. JSC189]